MDTVLECDRQTDGQSDRITITKTVQRIASHGKNKRRAVAAQTVRCRSKVLSMQYVYNIRAYQRHWKGRQMASD